MKIGAYLLLMTFCIGCTKQMDSYSCDLEFFKYYSNEKVYLEISPNELWLSIGDISETESRNILMKYESIDMSKIDYKPPFVKLKLINISNCSQIIDLSDSLLLNTSIEYVNFLFKSSEDGVFYPYSNTFTIKPYQTTTSSQFDSLLTLTKTRILRVGSSSNNLDIIVDKNSSGNALELSIYFYETGLFEYSEPNSYGYYTK